MRFLLLSGESVAQQRDRLVHLLNPEAGVRPWTVVTVSGVSELLIGEHPVIESLIKSFVIDSRKDRTPQCDTDRECNIKGFK